MYDAGYPIQFDFTNEYTPPQGNGLEFRLGDTNQLCEIFIPARGIVDFNFDKAPPETLDFDFVQTCYPSEDDGTDPPVEPDSGQPDGTGRKIGWTSAVPADRSCMLPWSKRPPVDRRIVLPFGNAERMDCTGFTVSWSAPYHVDTTLSAGWVQAPERNGYSARMAWQSPERKHRLVGFSWNATTRYDTDVLCSWVNSCRAVDLDLAIRFGVPDPADRTLSSSWINTLRPVDVLHRTYWGTEYYERICHRDYEYPAGDNINFNFDTPINQVFDGINLQFYFESLSYDERCDQQEHSGWRDNYINVPVEQFTRVPVRGVYVSMSSMSLTRLSDSMDLPMRDGSVQIDFDSWCWGFSATLASEAAYLAVMPTVDGSTEVQLTINGYVFLLVVEEASETIRFGQRSWQISGRSVSAELAAPVAPVSSYTEDSQMTAVQLMEQAVLNTGWTINFSGVDWLVSANALSYSNKTPMEVVNMIAQAGGCRVQTVRGSKTLNIVPRYNGDPWDWAAATPDLSIPESVVKSFGHKWAGGPSYNGVYISGTNQGVICLVKRTGTDATPLAPMVTNPLITATEAARELGREHIAKSCSFDLVSIDLPLMETPDEPGLLLPGTIVQVVESRETYRGQVTSCKVRGVWNRGLVVRQNIEVERYYG